MAVRLLCGTHLSARTAHIDRLVREQWGQARLLLPTNQYAARRMEQIIIDGGLGGAWGRPILTFTEFAADLLRASGRNPVRVTDLGRRLLLEHAIEETAAQPALAKLGDAGTTNGFIAHILRTITLLKQAAIDPEAFRAKITQCHSKNFLDDILADLYAVYQRELLASGLYDIPGMFWEAALVCANEKPTALEGVETLILDGFDDFTPSEFRLLRAIEPHLNLLVFGLSYDPNPDRQDVFAVPARTAKAIQDAFGARIETFEERAPERFTEFAAAHVFWRNQPAPPENTERDIEILPCADFIQEIETISRKIKTLLRDGSVRIDEVAVIYHDLGDAAGSLRGIFGEMGIPVRVAQMPSLWESAVGAFLLHLLEATGEWTRETVVDVLTSPWFMPAGLSREHTGVYPVLSRSAQIITGLDEWRNQLSALAARVKAGIDEEWDALLARLPNVSGALDEMLAALDALRALGETVPRQGTPAKFAAAIESALVTARVEQAIDAYPVEPIRNAERAALLALRTLLAQLRFSDQYHAREQSRADFVALLRQALRETTFPLRQPHGVHCLNAESARHLKFDYVFFAGVNEGEVPRPPVANAVYSEEDIARLDAVGISIEGRRVHSHREMLLFHHILAVPRRKLWITWHRLSRRGKDEYPSPYIADLLSLFPGENIQAPMPAAHAFVPALTDAASWRDIQNVLFHNHAVPRSCPPQLTWVARAAAVEARRDHGPLDAYDGMLSAPDVVEHIATAFDENHLFSVQQTETYAGCPFRFFIERVLKIEQADIPVAEFDSMVRGTIMHEVLERFHEHYRGQSVLDIPFGEAMALLRDLVGQVFGDFAWRSKTAPPGVEMIERLRLEMLLDRYLRIEHNRNDPEWKPAHFEVSFGHARGGEKDPLSTPDPFPLTTLAGPVLFSGRIDRIDLDGAGHARIIDYKSSIPFAAKDIKEGRCLQLAVYALAVQEFLLQGATCADAYFLAVGKDDRLEGLGRKKNQWGEREAAARASIAKSVAGIRNGKFPPVPSNDACKYCAATNACRYDKARMERKSRPNDANA